MCEKEKIKEILNVAFKDSRRGYGHELKLLFYGEPNIVWVPTDYPPKMERVWRYPYVASVSITPLGGRLKVEISGGADPLVFYCETWKEAFDRVTEEVAKLCNYSVTRAELVYTTSDVIWPPKEV